MLVSEERAKALIEKWSKIIDCSNVDNVERLRNAMIIESEERWLTNEEKAYWNKVANEAIKDKNLLIKPATIKWQLADESPIPNDTKPE